MPTRSSSRRSSPIKRGTSSATSSPSTANGKGEGKGKESQQPKLYSIFTPRKQTANKPKPIYIDAPSETSEDESDTKESESEFEVQEAHQSSDDDDDVESAADEHEQTPSIVGDDDEDSNPTPSANSPRTPANLNGDTASGYFSGTDPFVDLTNVKPSPSPAKRSNASTPLRNPRHSRITRANNSGKKQVTLTDLFGGGKPKRARDDDGDIDDFIADDDDDQDATPRRSAAKKAKSTPKKTPSASTGKGWKSKFAKSRRFVRMDFVPHPQQVDAHRQQAIGKSLSGDYPPIHDLADIFRDMIDRAPGVLELAKTLKDRPLRVATMCSGTESPLLALELMARAIKEKHGIRIKIEHVFSCEIEPFKQAYIERNFSPPILFRDVTELGGDKAYTAYGALVDVPGNVDLLVAGTSCVDYSQLNNKKKGLNDGGESGRTFHGMLSWVKRHKPPLVILENIKGAPWQGVAETIVDEAGYDVSFSNTFDTKHYYIPHTRQRGYLVATKNVDDCLPENWDLLTTWLIRPASSPLDAFLLPSDDPRIQTVRNQFAQGLGLAKNRAAIDWSKCQSRHERARDEENLGQTRPLTAWEEGGTCKMSHDGWNEWAARQPERVTDLLDITTLRFAAMGQDPIYKSKIWELSQNVDRNVAGARPGIIGCLTPSGMPYLSSRGGPLIGLEALSLQGLPLDELLLTRENDDQLQDLAGNAMSSTVVGACVLSALLVATQDLAATGKKQKAKKGSAADAVAASLVVDEVPEDGDQIVGATDLKESPLDLTSSITVDMPQLLRDAVETSQFCNCEGRTAVTSRSIFRCTRCDHTACEKCKGRPIHNFEPDTHPRRMPDEFAVKLKEALPMRLHAEGIDADVVQKLAEGHEFENSALAKRWCARVGEVLSGAEFRFQDLLRQEVWQARFKAPGAQMDLILDPIEPHWRIFVEAATSELAGSPLRTLLIQPVARMTLNPLAKKTNLLHGEWELCLPTHKVFNITITSKGNKVPTWESAMGLQGPFTDNQRFCEMHVSVPDEAKALLDSDVEGTYDLLEHCGTACGALHVRRGDQNTADSRKLYLFIDADRFQDDKGDRFVFSTDIRRWPYPLERVTVARLQPGWRPKPVLSAQTEVVQKVPMHISGSWTKLSMLKIASTKDADGIIAVPRGPIEMDLREHTCEHALAVLNASAPTFNDEDQTVRIWPMNGVWGQVDLLHKTNTTFSHLAWLVERVPDITAFQEWMSVQHEFVGFSLAGQGANASASAVATCSKCAPAEPEIQWLAVPGKAITPVENAMQAGPYEQALKNRPPPFVMHLRLHNGQAQVRFGLNAATLMHRALARLPPARHAGDVELSWRLTKLDESLDMFSLPAYTIKSNRSDVEADTPKLFALELRKEQKRSLTWMLEQEREDVAPFYEEEISEGLLSPLGWRAEGRATRTIKVRGGVLADAVGYGKTAISLALIAASPYREVEPKLEADDKDAFIPTKATLVIVPGHLCKQWQKEVSKFCRKKLTVIVVTSKAELNKLTVKEVLNSDIIIMSVTVYKSDAYWETLARMAAANPLPNRAGRFFNAALKRSLSALRNRVRELKTEGIKKVAESVRTRADFDDSHMTSHKARGRLIGQAYADAHKDEDDEAKGKGAQKATVPKELQQSKGSNGSDPWGLGSSAVRSDWTRMTCPPLEMFMWNRVVVDEFHYIAESMDRTLAGVTSLQARAKWILSGTPPTADFADVKSIAVFLDIHLGVDDDADTIKDSVRKQREKNRTAAEKFNNFREMHSPAWHHRRQEVAQRFLDAFVRSNEAEIGELPSEELIKPINLPAAEFALYLELAHAIENLDLRHQRKVFKGRNKPKPKAKAAAAKKNDDWLDDDDEVAYESDSDSDADLRKKKKKKPAAKEAPAPKRRAGDPNLEVSHRDQRLIDTLGNSSSPEEALLKRASVYDDFAGIDLESMEGVNNAIKACEYIVRERRRQLEDCREQLEQELPAALEQHMLVLHHFGFRDENRQFFADFVRNANNAAWGDGESKAMVKDMLVRAGCTMASVSREAARRHFSAKGSLAAALKQRERERGAESKEASEKERAWAEEFHLRTMVHQLTRLRNELVGRVNALRFFTMVRDCQRAHLEGVTVKVRCPGRGCPHAESGEPVPMSEVAISSTCGHSGCRACVTRDAWVGRCPTEGCAALAKPASIVLASSLGAEDAGHALRYGTKLALLCTLLHRLPSSERALVFVQFETLTATVAEALTSYGISFIQLTDTARKRSEALESFQDGSASSARVLLLNIDDESAAGSNLTVANHVIFVGPLLKQEQQQYDATMTQAIGRCVRYGQTRKVNVWRLVVCDTLDQEIVEKREGRTLDTQALESRFTEVLDGPLVVKDVEGRKKRRRDDSEDDDDDDDDDVVVVSGRKRR